MLARAIRSLFALGVVSPLPAGIIADTSANFGETALASNVNAYSENLLNSAGTTTAGTNTTLTAAQVLAGVVRLDAGASGGYTITLPSTASIIAALGITIPANGTFTKRITIINNNVGQIGTVTAGDASTTLTGTMTIATNTVRELLLTVMSATTITIQNAGSKAL